MQGLFGTGTRRPGVLSLSQDNMGQYSCCQACPVHPAPWLLVPRVLPHEHCTLTAFPGSASLTDCSPCALVVRCCGLWCLELNSLNDRDQPLEDREGHSRRVIGDGGMSLSFLRNGGKNQWEMGTEPSVSERTHEPEGGM